MVAVYTAGTRKRIRSAVLKVERMTETAAAQPRCRRAGTSQRMMLVEAAQDIAHNELGDAYRMESSGQVTSIASRPDDETVKVFNPWQKIWAGATCLIDRVAVKGTTRTSANSSAEVWVIVKAYSATRLRGKSMASIAPGGTGTINTLVAIDGTFRPTTATVRLPTEFVAVDANRVVWAELVGSEWQIYSADCDGV